MTGRARPFRIRQGVGGNLSVRGTVSGYDPVEQVFLPLRTVSEANTRGHWRARGRRVKGQRDMARLVLRANLGKPVLPVLVTLTRVSPRELDDDNLRGALKAIRDGVADFLGVDDGDKRVRWEYAQERWAPREYGVVVRVEEVRSAKER